MVLGIPTFLFYFFIHVIKGCEEYTIEDSYDEYDDQLVIVEQQKQQKKNDFSIINTWKNKQKNKKIL
jgi:hypothetical protein